MSDTVRKLKIIDDIIDTENEVMFGVLNGAQNSTSQGFRSISATPNAMVFNIVVPSLETVLDRHIMITTQMTLEINYLDSDGGTTKPACIPLVSYGTSKLPFKSINLYSPMQYQQQHHLLAAVRRDCCTLTALRSRASSYVG